MDINQVKSICKQRLSKDDLKKNIHIYNTLFDKLTLFVNNDYNLRDCMVIVHGITRNCTEAMDRSCKVVKEITKLNDEDTCKICPFNIFCATVVKTDKSYHHNINRICNRLLLMAKAKNINKKDREYIKNCYDRIVDAPELKKIDKFLDRLDD